MKRLVAMLIFALPAASVLAVAVLFYLASRSPDAVIEPAATPLSKTSWRKAD